MVKGGHRLLFLVGLSLWLCLVSPATSELQRLQHPTIPDGDGTLSFLVVGDWGREGNYNQSEVASQMGVIGEKLDIDFVISTGDNFYEDGLTGEDDPEFLESFTDIYTAPSLQKPWYNVLGNHDYRGDVEAQLSPALRKKDSRWICFRSSILNAEIVEFFFVDTNLLKDVDSALKESSAKWKIVVGHHTIKSAGHHGVTVELVEHLLPILEANHIDLYVNGHDHCLEHITSTDSEIQFITSGGGSKAWRGDIRSWKPEEMKFYYDGQGFLSVSMTGDQADLVFYDVFGQVLHEWSISKQLHDAA